MAETNRALELLKAGEPWKKVSANSGKSSVFKGFSAFFEFAEPRVHAVRVIKW